MAEQFLSSSESQLFEQTIYEELKTLNKKDSILSQKVQELKTLYEQYSIASNASSFHDKKRFGLLKEMATSEYRILQREKIEKQQVNVINQIYELVNNIISILTQREEPLNYAIYFTGPDGKMYRTQKESIELTYLNISKSNQSMRLSSSAFKKAVLEQNQAVDITAHYGSYMKVLQDTYRGKNKLPNRKINAGIIAEAFERHLQKIHSAALSSNGNISVETGYDWTVEEAWRLIKQSLGTDPWYTGGDVGSTQVKNIGKGNVRLTQFNTIEDIVNYIYYLSEEQYDNETLLKQAKQAAQILFNEANDIAEEGTNFVIEDFFASMENRF